MKYEDVEIGGVYWVGRVNDGDITKLRRATVKGKGPYVKYWGKCGRTVKRVRGSKERMIWIEVTSLHHRTNTTLEDDVVTSRSLALTDEQYQVRSRLIESDRARHATELKKVETARATLMDKILTQLKVTPGTTLDHLEISLSSHWVSSKKVATLRLYAELDVAQLKACGVDKLFTEMINLKDPAC